MSTHARGSPCTVHSCLLAKIHINSVSWLFICQSYQVVYSVFFSQMGFVPLNVIPLNVPPIQRTSFTTYLSPDTGNVVPSSAKQRAPKTAWTPANSQINMATPGDPAPARTTPGEM